MIVEFQIIYVISLMIPLGLFLFFRKYLDNINYLKKILLFLLGIATIGIMLSISHFGKNQFYISLINPFLSLAIYRCLFLIFFKKMKRPPIDTAFNFSINNKIDWDRAFNIGYIFFGIILPMYLTFGLIKLLN